MFACVWTCNSFDYPRISMADGKLDRQQTKKQHGILYYPQFDMLQTTLSALALCAILLIKTQYELRIQEKKNM